MEPAQPQRFLVAIGARRLADGSDLPSVPDDLRRIAGLFGLLGYHEVFPDLRDDPPPAIILDRLSTWLGEPRRSAEDLLVLYYSGHGDSQAGRHYLLLGGSDPGRLAGTALRTQALADLLGDQSVRLRRLLILLDTCYAGQGAFDVATVLGELTRSRPLGEGPELWVLAAARSREEASQSSFSEALLRAVADPKAGERQRWLTLEEVVDAINAEWCASGLAQRAVVAGSGYSVTPFLPNRNYVTHLPPGLDVETQKRWQTAARMGKADAKGFAAHWGPRSRGVEIEAQPGWYFTGRAAALRSLVGWLEASQIEPALRVVTGGPGSGKSAILARLVTLADPQYRQGAMAAGVPAGTMPRVGAIDVAIHARGKTLDQVVAELAAAAGVATGEPAELVDVLARRSSLFVVVLDALDEATEPRRIAAEILLPLVAAARASTGLRLLVGTRSELLPALHQEGEILDLDDDEEGRGDLTEYVARLLADEDGSPYHGQTEAALPVARAVANRAFPSFLFGRLLARHLVAAGKQVDPDSPETLRRMPASVGQAFEEYIERFGAFAEKVRDLLEPLAYSPGVGLPWDSLWAPLAAALSGRPYGDADVRWLLANAASYVVEELEGGRSVYRLYHLALAEHLRSDGRAREVHRRFVRTLVGLTPDRPGGGKAWLQAHPYVRSYLATHAARSGELDPLLDDPLFLLAAERSHLLRALGAAEGEAAQQAAAIYRRAADRFQPDRPPGDAASYFELAARQARALAQAARIASLPLRRSWRPIWTQWEPSSAHTLVGRHEGRVLAPAFADGGDEPILVSGGRDGVRIWRPGCGSSIYIPTAAEVMSIATGTVAGRQLAFAGLRHGGVVVLDTAGGNLLKPIPMAEGVRALAFCALDQGPVLVIGTAYEAGEIHLWDLARGVPMGEPRRAFRGSVQALAAAPAGGRPLLAAAGHNLGEAAGLVKVYELPHLETVCVADTGSAGLARSLVVSERQGRAVAVSGDHEARIQVWDLETAKLLDEAVVPSGLFSPWIEAIAATELDGLKLVMTARGRSIHAWRLNDLTRWGEPLEGHGETILALAAGRMESRAVVFSGSEDGTVRAWSLAEVARPRQAAAGHQGTVYAVAATRLDDQPAVASGGEDGTLRLWRLADGSPRGKPLVGHQGPIYALATGWLAGRPVAASGGSDQLLRRWFLDDGSAVGEPLAGHGAWIRTLALAEVGAKLVLASGDSEFGIFLWDFASGEKLRTVRSSYFGKRSVLALALTEHAGRWLLVLGGGDRQLSVLDLEAEEQPRSVGMFEYVRSIIIGSIAGRDTIVAGLDNCRVYLYDLAPFERDDLRWVRTAALGDAEHHTFRLFTSRALHGWVQPLGELAEHRGWVQAVALGEVGGDTVILSGGKDRALIARTPDGKRGVRIELDAEIHAIVHGEGQLYVVATRLGLAALELQSLDPLARPPA